MAELNIEKMAQNAAEKAIQELMDNGVFIGRWIPVGERLPKKNMPCLVCAGKLLLTQIAIYSDLMGTIDHKIFYQGDYGHENFVDITQYVIAWMPLPEPYAESEIEDGNDKRRSDRMV